MANLLKSTTGTRNALIIIWWASFVTNLGSLVYLFARSDLEPIDFWPAVQKLNILYIPYLGTITAFYWGKEQSAASGAAASSTSTVSSMSNALALGCSLIWNGMVLFFIFRLVLLYGPFEDSVEAIEKLAGLFVWLVAPALGYCFAKSGPPKEPERKPIVRWPPQ